MFSLPPFLKKASASSLMSRRTTTATTSAVDEGMLGAPELRYGVSLRHLSSLPIGLEAHFEMACVYAKKQSEKTEGYRSYAKTLLDDPKTAHLVKKQADVFVSYAWSGGYGRTMRALCARAFPKGDASPDVFVWMDFAVVDQHAAATTDIDFDEWRSIFHNNLIRTKKAMIVLFPAEKPIAISRSWCCVEWVSVIESRIPYEYCVVPEDESTMIHELQRGLGLESFYRIFAGANVERAVAFKPSDQQRILELMIKIGLTKVNDIVMNSLKDWLLQMIEKARIASKDNPQALTRVLNSGGVLQRVMGNVDEALKFHQQALKTAKSIPNNNGSIAVQYNNLGLVYLDLGKYDQAESNFKEALKMWRAAHGDSHQNVATALHNLGYLYAIQGRVREAEQFDNDARVMRETTLGPDHIETLLTVEALADLYRELAKYDEAEPLFARALASIQRTKGENHNHLGTALTDRGTMYVEQGKFAEAAADLERALGIHDRNLGKYHVDVFRAQNALGRLYTETGDFVKAEEFIQTALASRKRMLREFHPEVAISTYTLGALYFKQDKLDQAEKLLTHALALQKRNFGSYHPDVARTLGLLADLYSKQDRKLDDAKVNGKAALLSASKSLGDEHPLTVGLKEKWA